MSKFEAEYTIKEALGSGSYAEVFRCTHKEKAGDYALKVVNKQKAGSSGLASVKSEVGILQQLNHPNIIYVKDFFETGSSLYIVLELVLGGELFDKIVELKHYSELMAAKLTLNLCETLAYMHSQGIVHRDLKPENLLLKEKTAKAATLGADPTEVERMHFEKLLTNVKLVDFGFAIHCPPGTSNLKECCGTPNFIAPEILSFGYFKSTSEGYNEKCDMWSTGVLAYILLCGYPPFHAASRTQMFRKICSGEFLFHANTVWDNISPEAKDFVKKLMNKNPKDRLSAAQALEHPWLGIARSEMAVRRNTTLDVNLAETTENLKTFKARQKLRGAIFGMEAVHRLMYVSKCKELSVKPNTALVQQLAKEEAEEEDITVLDLSNNYLGVKGLKAALESLGPTSTIHTLKLCNNQIDNAGITVICECLKARTNITAIDLSGNPVTQLAGRQLLNLLQENRHIRALNLDQTFLKDTMLAKINAQLDRNKAAGAESCEVM
eukprot:RCo039131